MNLQSDSFFSLFIGFYKNIHEECKKKKIKPFNNCGLFLPLTATVAAAPAPATLAAAIVRRRHRRSCRHFGSDEKLETDKPTAFSVSR